MNHFTKFTVLGALLVTSASFALADTISLGSFATGTTASSLGFSASQTAIDFAGYTAFSTPPPVASTPVLLSGVANSYALAPNGVWGSALGNSTWVGYAANAGPGGTNPAYGYYQFTTDFTAAGGAYNGSFDLMGDDTVEVLLNGAMIVPFGALGADTHCAAGAPSCSAADIVSLSGFTLLSGSNANILTFIVEQAGTEAPGSDPSGFDFTANIASAVAPEPSSLILLGTGLLSAAGLLYRRRRPATTV